MDAGRMRQRIIGILLRPKEEWVPIIAESGEPKQLVVPYAVVLAALLPVGLFVATVILGERRVFLGVTSTYRAPLFASLVMAVLLSGALVAAGALLGLFVNLLAPGFEARHEPESGYKLAAYAMTPLWVAGASAIFSTLHPSLFALHVLVMVAGALWGWYLLYCGLPILLGAPEDKALTHSILAVLATTIATGVVINLLYALFGPLLLSSVLPPA
ncbi:MAG: DUF1282 domain-containing protein [Myxococcales bacterium]|nr:DUF1282 domain-containing protein [Myxococcales bacterium]